MKKALLMILALMVLTVTAACSDKSLSQDATQTTAPESAQTPAPTPVPDYSGTDFSGDWVVAEVLDSSGAPVTSDVLASLNADFMLELLADGVYFVYDAAGAVLGQGSYLVEKNLLTLTAGEVQTVYTIVDAGTLHCIAGDASITVMTRLPEEAPEQEDQETDEDREEGEEGEEGETPSEPE